MALVSSPDLDPIATGGTVTWFDNGDGTYDEIHTFTASGDFVLSEAVIEAKILIVAGGGGGAANNGGGGGGGGVCYNSSLDLTASTYPIVVGTGGAAGTSGRKYGYRGGNSSFNGEIIAYGGGGGTSDGGSWSYINGGSCGGAGYNSYTGTPQKGTYTGWSVYGNIGGTLWGGGGGAGAAGATGTGDAASGVGGAGRAFDISGTSKYYAGGGGGGNYSGSSRAGGSGGGGKGGINNNGSGSGGSGTANTGGGGGGGGGYSASGGAGGSGIVIIRFPFEPIPDASENFLPPLRRYRSPLCSGLPYVSSPWSEP